MTQSDFSDFMVGLTLLSDTISDGALGNQSLDVTTLVDSLFSGSETHAGFVLRTNVVTANYRMQNTLEGDSSFGPKLTIVYVPESGSLTYLACTWILLGLVIFKRRRIACLAAT